MSGRDAAKKARLIRILHPTSTCSSLDLNIIHEGEDGDGIEIREDGGGGVE